jgi:hypothetical protein
LPTSAANAVPAPSARIKPNDDAAIRDLFMYFSFLQLNS